MNFLKKTFTMFIAICITTSLFLTGCSGCSGCRPNIDEESVPEEMEKTDHYLLKGGVSPYKIVIPGDADTDELVAGERLQSLFKEATNVLLPIVQDTTLSTIDGDGEYILIGDNNFAIENDMVPQKADVKSTGYTIKTKDKYKQFLTYFTNFVAKENPYKTLCKDSKNKINKRHLRNCFNLFRLYLRKLLKEGFYKSISRNF